MQSSSFGILPLRGPVFIDAIQIYFLPSSLAVNNPFCITFSSTGPMTFLSGFSSFHSPLKKLKLHRVHVKHLTQSNDKTESQGVIHRDESLFLE